MPAQCNCPQKRWALPSLMVNVMRVILMAWALFQSLGHPAMAHQLTVILVRSAATVIVVWQGGFY